MIAQTTTTFQPPRQIQKDYDLMQLPNGVWFGEVFDCVTGQTLITLKGKTEASV